MSSAMWNLLEGGKVCVHNFSESEMRLVGDILMRADSLSIFKGLAIAVRCVQWDASLVETVVSIPNNGHTHVSLNIVVCAHVMVVSPTW